MMTTRKLLLAGLLMAGLAAPAGAAIQCQNGRQYNTTANGWISTPYCGEFSRRARGLNLSDRSRD